jgi:hypothetical protein
MPTLLQDRRRQKILRKFVLSMLYVAQQCLGWALMLVSMTFSVELFLCVIMGVVVGKIIFPVADHQPQHERYRNARVGNLRPRNDDGVADPTLPPTEPNESLIA